MENGTKPRVLYLYQHLFNIQTPRHRTYLIDCRANEDPPRRLFGEGIPKYLQR